jgi:hypothetical protein
MFGNDLFFLQNILSNKSIVKKYNYLYNKVNLKVL